MEANMADILYEDNHLLVCIKPANVPVQEDSTHDPDMLSILKSYIKNRYNKPGNVFIGLVHRLDRPVGGVMVFARTSKAASRLSEEIRNHTFIKNYLAVVKGTPQKKSGIFHDYLYKDEVKNVVNVVDEGFPGSKEAILSYEMLVSENDLSLIKINLMTGRPHQIRVQFSSRGLPLAGDMKYGNNTSRDNIALWSYSVNFKHPTKDETMLFKALPPDIHPWNLFGNLTALNITAEDDGRIRG